MLNIFKDSSIYLVGEILSKILPFILIPYLSNKLGAELYGELALLQTYLALIVIFIGINQHGAIARYYYRYGHRTINNVKVSGEIIATILAVIFFIIAVILGETWFSIIIFTAFFQVLISVQLSLRQCQKNALGYVYIQLILNVLIFVFTVFYFEFFMGNPYGYFLSLLISNFLCYLILSNINIGKYKNCTKKTLLSTSKYIFSFGGPLIIHQLALFSKGYLDRLLIIDQYTSIELGVYSIAFQLAAVFQVIMVAINKAIVPYYYESLKNNKLKTKDILKYAVFSLVIIPIPVIFIYFIPESLLLLFIGESFVGVKHFLIVFVAGILMNLPYFIMINYLFYQGKTVFVAKVNIVSAIIHIYMVYVFSGLDIYYIPYALFISNLILVSLIYLYILRFNK